MGGDMASPLFVPREEDLPLLDATESAVIHTLAYFSVFQHPLTRREISVYLQGTHATDSEVNAALTALINRGLIEKESDLFFLPGQGFLTSTRYARSTRAEHWQERIRASARWLSRFPFVEALLLTGSLSKGTQDMFGDIDFLVISAPGRVWTSLFFIRLACRIVRRGDKRFICPNYFLAADRLAVERRNVFTATEVVFSRPVVNATLCEMFFSENPWVSSFYPRWMPDYERTIPPDSSLLTKATEQLLRGSAGNLFEAVFSRWGRARYQRYKSEQGEDANEGSMHAGEVIGHRRSRQRIVRERLMRALREYEDTHHVRTAALQWEREYSTRRQAA